MQGNLHHYKQLTVISDTALYYWNGKSFGFGPVVRELESIAFLFDTIIWVGFERNDMKHNSIATEITNPNIKMVLLNKSGGNTLFEKLQVLANTPKMIYVIIKSVVGADVVHTRAPSSPAFLAVLISFLLKKKIWWNKYAGNWEQDNPPFFYGLQKKLLEKALHSTVTINGKWPTQPKHCMSFENPCIDEQEQHIGAELLKTKNYNTPLTGIFVGRLETWKGVDKIIESLPVLISKGLEAFHFVGGGEKLSYYKEVVTKMDLSIKVIFHDYLSRDKISHLFIESHVILLPSDNEGFPKVIAEAANYGCVPIVSNVSSLPHYINESNGFLWDINKGSFREFVESINLSSENLQSKAKEAFEMSKLFTFDRYAHRILELINVNRN